jgi:large subunit ribosomal protein L20
VTYSQFINGLKKVNVLINRKMLSEMAIHDPQGFAHLVTLTKGEGQLAAA